MCVVAFPMLYHHQAYKTVNACLKKVCFVKALTHQTIPFLVTVGVR